MFCITNVTFILPLPPLAISILPSHSALSSRPSMLSKHSSCSANKAAQSIWQTTSFLITTTTTATTIIIICNHYYFYQVKVPTFLPLRPQCQPQVTLVLLWPYFSDSRAVLQIHSPTLIRLKGALQSLVLFTSKCLQTPFFKSIKAGEFKNAADRLIRTFV